MDLLRVSRIDHDVRCVEDEKLIQSLIEEQIPLTVCPHSNVKLCVYERMEDHNLNQLLDLGLCATVNSDDPAYFGGYMNENYQSIYTALKLSNDDVYSLAKNGITASFASEALKQDLFKELNDYMNHLH